MKRTLLLGALGLALLVLICYWSLGKEGATENDSSYRLLVKQRSNLYERWQNLTKQPRPMLKVDQHLPTLSPEVVSGVKKFVLFIGYPRSGHSIVASILDAHPHMVISNEFMLMERKAIFSEPPTQNWTSDLFNVLYQHSYLDVFIGSRHRLMTTKGYALNIEGLWQGGYDGFVDVIGDKSGGSATAQFLYDQLDFEYNYKQLVARLPVPIKVVHVVRNPYDMISTATIYTMITKMQLTPMDFVNAKKSLLNNTLGPRRKRFVNETLLDNKIRFICKKISAAMKITELVGEENVLVIHSSDLVHSPRETILRMCKFFEVSVPDDFLKKTSEKVFSSVSQTRELIEWPSKLVDKVDEQIKQYKIFRRYNFTSD